MAEKKKTIRDLIFKNKEHKDFQKSNKINYANKGILRLILFYTIVSVLTIGYRDYQYKRNLDRLLSESSWQKLPVVVRLREKTMIENLLIVLLSTAVAFVILYYYNKKMIDSDNKG